MAKIFQLWELFLNLLKAFFPCAHKFIWKREAKDIVLSVGCCLPKPACFPRRSICTYSSEWSPSTETCCSARAGMENILPSYAASFSRLFFFRQLAEVSAAVYNTWILQGAGGMNWGSSRSWTSHMPLQGAGRLLSLSLALQNILTFISFKHSWNNRKHFQFLNEISACLQSKEWVNSLEATNQPKPWVISKQSFMQ